MRPIRLEIEGFTSFRKKVEIDFSGMTLFTITGPTGAGKTSLIDALIYALYGRTPRIGSSLSDLISQGSDRLSVLLEFSSTGRRYRVARLIKRGKKTTTSDVRFEEWVDEKWISQSDKSKQAGSMIEKIVGLDFDGFTKSVVLPQGKFDEFLRGDVAARRKILSDLLQLDVYVRMMRRANDLAQEHKGEAEHLQKELALDFADATPEKLAELRKEHEKFEAECQKLEKELERLRTLLPDALRLRQARADRARVTTEQEQITPELDELEAEIERTREIVEKAAMNVGSLESDLQTNSYDPEIYAKLTATVQKSQQLTELATRIERLAATEQESKAKLEEAQSLLNQAREQQGAAAASLKGAEETLAREKKELDAALAKHGSPDAINSLIESNERRLKDEAKKTALEEDIAAQTASQKSKLREIATIGKQLDSAEAVLARELETLESLRRQHAAAELRLAIAVGEPCPVCLRTVKEVPKAEEHPSLEAAKGAVESQRALIEGLRTRKLTTEAVLAPLQEKIDGIESQIEDLRTEITGAAARIGEAIGKPAGPDSGEELVNLRKLVVQCQVKCDESVRVVESRRKEERTAGEKAASLDRDAASLQATLKQLSISLESQRGEAANLRSELGKYADLSTARAELEGQLSEKHNKDELEASLGRERKVLADAKDKMAEQTRAVEAFRSRGNALAENASRLGNEIDELSASLMAALPDLDVAAEEAGDAASQIEERHGRVQSSCNQARTNVVERREQINVIEKKIKRAAEIKAQIDNHTEEAGIAGELGLLLRANNFIAYIQQEAYQRLATDGSTHFKILSSDRYSFGFDKDEFVALDHWNADEPRPVTTLSGGESFLASLALALALAEGLSGLSHSRGRAALESLFLDEGFGMLDAETLDVVLGGLETLTASDRMVGIVSHIPELAERLPSRIEVTKAATGSTILCS